MKPLKLLLTLSTLLFSACSTTYPVKSCYIVVGGKDEGCRCSVPGVKEIQVISLQECSDKKYIAFPPESVEALMKKLAEAQKK